MIRFDKEHNIFYLSGPHYSYIMFVNEGGYLQGAYYGGKVDEDAQYILRNAKRYNFPAGDLNYEYQCDCVANELASYGRLDFHEPTVIVKRNDGARMSRFKYVSHSISEELPDMTGLPHIRRGGQTLSILLQDDFSDTRVQLNYIVLDDCDALVRNLEIINSGTEDMMLHKAFSYCLDFDDANFKLLKLEGEWLTERNMEITDIGHGITKIHSLRGKSSHQTSPFMGLLRPDCTEEAGECFGIGLLYSGCYSMTAEVSSHSRVRVQGGISELEFCWKLAAGEKFITPQTVFVYGSSGIGSMSRSFADFYRGYVIHPKWVYAKRPVVNNHWSVTEFQFTEKELLKIIDESAKLGIDMFVLDDAWFGRRYDEHSSLGDWYVNETKLKGGLNTLIDRCKQNGMKFGIWFEPEAISEDSDLYRAHPEYAIRKAGVEPTRSRYQLVLDFTKPEVVDCIFRQIDKILSDYDISYLKWDMNRDLSELYTDSLPAERQGEILHRYMLGVYELLDRLTQKHPDVLFEGCASGGGRFDGGMLYYCPQIQASDTNDPWQRGKNQYGSSVCYPLSAVSCHVSDREGCCQNRHFPMKTRCAISSIGTLGYEFDTRALTEEERQEVISRNAQWDELYRLINRGDLYRLMNPFETDMMAFLVVDKAKQNGYAVVECGKYTPNKYKLSLKFSGLQEDTVYEICELGIKATGRTLHRIGVELPRLHDYESYELHLKAVQ